MTHSMTGQHWRAEQRRHYCRRRRARLRVAATNIVMGIALGVILVNIIDLVR